MVKGTVGRTLYERRLWLNPLKPSCKFSCWWKQCYSYDSAVFKWFLMVNKGTVTVGHKVDTVTVGDRQDSVQVTVVMSLILFMPTKRLSAVLQVRLIVFVLTNRERISRVPTRRSRVSCLSLLLRWVCSCSAWSAAKSSAPPSPCAGTWRTSNTSLSALRANTTASLTSSELVSNTSVSGAAQWIITSVFGAAS